MGTLWYSTHRKYKFSFKFFEAHSYNIFNRHSALLQKRNNMRMKIDEALTYNSNRMSHLEYVCLALDYVYTSLIHIHLVEVT